VGGIASSYYSGSLIEEYGTKFVFGITAFFPLLIMAAAALVQEAPVRQGLTLVHIRAKLEQLHDAFMS